MPRVSRKNTTANAIDTQTSNEVIYNTALYLRLSVLDSGKVDGESIINQQEFLQAYIAQHPELALKPRKSIFKNQIVC